MQTETQLMNYRAMIRSALDYGCLVSGSAAKSILTQLDVVTTMRYILELYGRHFSKLKCYRKPEV